VLLSFAYEDHLKKARFKRALSEPHGSANNAHLFTGEFDCKQQSPPCQRHSQGGGVNLHRQKVYALLLRALMLGDSGWGKSGNQLFHNKNAIQENNIKEVLCSQRVVSL